MTTAEKTKTLSAAMQAAGAAESALRAFRAEVDIHAYEFAEAERKALTDAADEASKILVRVFKVQEAVRTVAVGSN